jgi:hypothetical protein
VSLSSAHSVQACGHPIPFRTSPVFPLTKRFIVPDLKEETGTLAFACFDPAFPVLARLSNDAPPEVSQGVLFSLGLASVIFWSRSDNALSQLEQAAGAKSRSSETWKIVRGELQHVECNCPTPDPIDASLMVLPPHDVLPVPARATVDEFVSSICLLIQKIQTHVPGELPTFIKLIDRVRELVAEMVYACRPDGPPPPTLSEHAPGELATDRKLAEQILHQAWDRLIQINSALSYLPTQALSGAVPILERRSLIRRHSLLGVGTAVLALTRLARSIEHAFSIGALEEGIEKIGALARPLPGLDHLPEYETKDWALSSVSTWKAQLSKRSTYVKLPYFSGRLGFRETEYTISASLQSLTAGADPEWSFLTLTHEMVHGHVRNLLTLIFQDNPDRGASERWSRFHQRYAARVDQRPPADESLVDSLRAVILAYCSLAQTHGSLTREPDHGRRPSVGRLVGYEFFLPDEADLWHLFETEYRNISEILVHVLDLHYFYASRLSAYVPLIWRSWAPIPQVKGDLRQYILRTLLVASSKLDGTPYQRFKKAKGRVAELLTPLSQGNHRGSRTIREALAVVAGDRSQDALFQPFYASLILVDLARHVLTSDAIRGAVNGRDPHITRKSVPTNFEEWLEYDLPEGFVDTEVQAPAVLLADRLLRNSTLGGPTHLEAETVKLFLACASRPDANGDYHG